MSDEDLRPPEDIKLVQAEGDTEEELPGGEIPSPSMHFASRFDGLSGIIAPLITTLIAFLMGGLVVALTGKNPIKVYHAIWDGTGLEWFFHVGNHSTRIPFSTAHMWFPWDTASVAAQN